MILDPKSSEKYIEKGAKTGSNVKVRLEGKKYPAVVKFIGIFFLFDNLKSK